MTGAASYTFLSETEWDEKIAAAFELAKYCRLCPRSCGVNRLEGRTGFCTAGNTLRISSIFAHHGEEPPVSGTGGSGTVFFSHCTLKCLFCQNYQLSHDGEGLEYTPDELADFFLGLQNDGCHNINLVTPSHWLPWILEALRSACRRGLHIPVVYNCGGYEAREPLAILKNIVDIYLPDMKYGDDKSAYRYSSVHDYVEVNQTAIREMFRQTGPLKTDHKGIASRGLIIRHLILPGNRAGSESIRRFLKNTFDPRDITMSVMAKYRPLYRAVQCDEIARMVSAEEYTEVRDAFLEEGFAGFIQEIDRIDSSFVIDFKQRKFERLTGE